MHPRDFLQFLATPAGAEFLREFSERSYARGQVISLPGDASDRVFIVRSGRVRVYLADEQRELTLAFLEPGDVFSTHTPTFVIAAQPTVLSLVATQRFAARLAQEPGAVAATMRVLGLLLHNSVELIQNLVFRDARQRLAHVLLRFARRQGRAEAGGWAVPLPFTLTEIALLLGSTRQTVSATLSEMERAGLVARQGRRRLLIRDMARLEDWAREAAGAAATSAGRRTGHPGPP